MVTSLDSLVRTVTISIMSSSDRFSLFSGGGAGFIGRELTKLLKVKGHEVTIISRQPGQGRITWVRFNVYLHF